MPAGEHLLTAFTLGLLGSGHCIAMCGGIAAALGMRACATPSGPGAAALALPLQAFGRLASYGALGALAGGAGAVAADLVPGATLILRAVAGAMLITMGLYVAGLWRGLLAVERVGGGLFRTARAVAAQAEGPARPLLFGLAWGLLPCGLVYSTLAWSLAAAGSAPGGALLMIAFGAGTLPAVSGAALLGAPLAEALRAPRTRRLAGASIIAFGFWTLLSGGALFSVAAATAAASSGDDAAATLHCRAGGDAQGLVDRRVYLIEREER
ncbi:MAG: sulfite exporter TauE/SafE family protein [Pseudomonadales bacterium]|jgi:sulfite exporter TauE/SafE|nr:sulfite exporter TauE/SafE family protein [Pseudomonadales bacterium]